MVDDEVGADGCTCAPEWKQKQADQGVHGDAQGDPERIQALTQHFARWVGPVAQVCHEVRSELVHVDVHVIGPHAPRASPPREVARPECLTLFTTGMSERRMRGPCEHIEHRAELVFSLPPDWRVDPRSWHDERHFWPIRDLQNLARYPHRRRTCLDYGHSIADGKRPRRLARGLPFCAYAFFPSLTLPLEVHQAIGPDGEPVHVLALYPLYLDELELKLRLGADALFDRLMDAGVTDVFDPHHPSVATRTRASPFPRSA